MLADIGIPMIFVQWPLMLCALIPVIIVEGLLIRRWIPLSYRDAFSGTTVANLLSTLIGVPLAWLAMLAVECAVIFPVVFASEKWHWKLDSPLFESVGFLMSVAWLGPTEDNDYSLVPVAAALLLIPCFYVSVWLERHVCLRMWRDSDPVAVRSGIYRANLASYVLLFILACGWVCFEILTKRR